MESKKHIVASNARDFARIGKLMLQKGKWNGKTIVPESYIAAATKPNELIDEETQDKVDFYGWQWWVLPTYRGMNDLYYARGVNGQYVIVMPSKNIIIVRLGDKRGDKFGKSVHHKETMELIDFALSQ
jgi:CubicO group peptidase (beta-lactamase class C family)